MSKERRHLFFMLNTLRIQRGAAPREESVCGFTASHLGGILKSVTESAGNYFRKKKHALWGAEARQLQQSLFPPPTPPHPLPPRPAGS